jgi:hypothetical protein
VRIEWVIAGHVGGWVGGTTLEASNTSLFSAPLTLTTELPTWRAQVDTSRMLFSRPTHTLAIVADLDLKSRHPTKFQWTSHVKMGTLTINHGEPPKLSVDWTATHVIESKIAYKNRSMELSELVRCVPRACVAVVFFSFIFCSWSNNTACADYRDQLCSRCAVLLFFRTRS